MGITEYACVPIYHTYLSPIADVLMILGLFSDSVGKVLLYYLIFLIVDASISIIAYIHEHF